MQIAVLLHQVFLLFVTLRYSDHIRLEYL